MSLIGGEPPGDRSILVVGLPGHGTGVFRQLNAATAFKAVHGYGKKRVQNVTVVDDLTRTKAQVERLEHRLY
jgi:hypothetical protein